MEGGRRGPEFDYEINRELIETKQEAPENRRSSTNLREYTERIKQELEAANERFKGETEHKAEKVRAEIQKKGLNMETLRGLVDTLRKTKFEAFYVPELNQILANLRYLYLEWDPAYHPFLQQIIDQLQKAVTIKNDIKK